MDWIMVVSPLLALSINVLTQIFTARFVRTSKSILFGAFNGLILNITIMIFCAAYTKLSSITVACILITYFCFSFCFFAFLNLNLTSLRIRTIRELLKNREGLKIADLQKLYSNEEVISRRLIRLAELKQIYHINGRWVLQSHKLLIIDSLLNAMRTLIFGDRFPTKKKD